jgi:ribosomal protein S18 acetylase RimI-like enzyme
MVRSLLTFTLRPATPTDAKFVERLEGVCMRSYAEALWGQWIPSVAKYGFDTARHRIVQVGGRDVGVIDVWPQDDHWSLDKLYLLPEVQGRGIGAQLLALVVGEARRANTPLRLSVLTSNPRALDFYKREGFREIGRTPQRITMGPAA